MKHTTKHAIVATVLALGLSGIAFAQAGIPTRENDPTSKPVIKPGMKGSGGDKKDMMRNASTSMMRGDEKKDSEGQNPEMMRQQMGEKLNKMGARFEATIAREEGLMTRILSRVEKVKTAGGKTDAAEKLVMDAKKHIDEAKGMLATLKANVDASTALTGTTATSKVAKKEVKTADGNIRKTTKEIEKHIQEAHKLLEKAVGTLRGVNGEKLQATTTPTIKTENKAANTQN